MSIFRRSRRGTEEPGRGDLAGERGQAPRVERTTAAGLEGVPPRGGRLREGPEAGRPRRRSLWGPREVGAAAVGAVGWGVLALARLIMAIATLIAVLIVLAIVLRDVDANAGNSIVKGIHDGANFFAGAFTGLITFKGDAKAELTVDWGIAALVYLVVGSLIARWIAGIGRSGLTYGRTRRLAS
ncbi:MAG TPA: hypothetical protein VGO14_08670 [Solirubrobacteraceae bacterium]|nr:hypothetical protein [Solirubrobacteraceae bacterium]